MSHHNRKLTPVSLIIKHRVHRVHQHASSLVPYLQIPPMGAYKVRVVAKLKGYNFARRHFYCAEPMAELISQRIPRENILCTAQSRAGKEGGAGWIAESRSSLQVEVSGQTVKHLAL